MKSLTIKELKEDKARYEQLLAERRQTLLEQVYGLKVEDAITSQIVILRMEGALIYVTGNLNSLEEKAAELTPAQMAENAAKLKEQAEKEQAEREAQSA